MAALMCAVIVMVSVSCTGRDGSSGHENPESVDEARIEAREAARKFVNRPWRDTVELQSQLLEVRAMQSKYRQAGREESAAAFDSTFVSTLKTVRPEIAAHLERAMANNRNAN